MVYLGLNSVGRFFARTGVLLVLLGGPATAEDLWDFSAEPIDSDQEMELEVIGEARPCSCPISYPIKNECPSCREPTRCAEYRCTGFIPGSGISSLPCELGGIPSAMPTPSPTPEPPCTCPIQSSLTDNCPQCSNVTLCGSFSCTISSGTQFVSLACQPRPTPTPPPTPLPIRDCGCTANNLSASNPKLRMSGVTPVPGSISLNCQVAQSDSCHLAKCIVAYKVYGQGGTQFAMSHESDYYCNP